MPSTKAGKLRSIATCSFRSASAFLPLSSTRSSGWVAMYWRTNARKEAQKVLFSTCAWSLLLLWQTLARSVASRHYFCFKLRTKFDLCFLRSLLARKSSHRLTSTSSDLSTASTPALPFLAAVTLTTSAAGALEIPPRTFPTISAAVIRGTSQHDIPGNRGPPSNGGNRPQKRTRVVWMCDFTW